MVNKKVDGVQSFVGDHGLRPFLGRLDVLVNCLPFTPSTKNFIDFDLIMHMKSGSFIVNISRGGSA